MTIVMRQFASVVLMSLVLAGGGCARNPQPAVTAEFSPQQAMQATQSIYLDVSAPTPESARSARDFLRADLVQGQRFTVVETPEESDAILRIDLVAAGTAGRETGGGLVGTATLRERVSGRTIYRKRIEPRCEKGVERANRSCGLTTSAVRLLAQDLHRAAGI